MENNEETKNTVENKVAEQKFEEQKFEELLQQLEKVAKQLSSGDLPLEQSLQLYAKGVELTRQCQAKLDKANMQIQTLSKKEGAFGKIDEEPF